MARGTFLSFEGGEGVGKTTQIARLAERLRDRGVDPVLVREPGGTALGEAVRALLLDPEAGPASARAELLLFLAARAEITDAVIEPALASGRVVIADRYVDASVAYQGGGRGLGRAQVGALNEFATGGLLPDLTLVLDLDPAWGLDRAGRRKLAPDRIEREDADFHARVREVYLHLARTVDRVVAIDAARPVDAVAQDVWIATEPRLFPA
jgi:dTMP kinase